MAPAKKATVAKAAASADVKLSRPKDYKPLAPDRVSRLLRTLKKTYPKVECALHHANAWQLLMATILSAQCTDVRVNMVTPVLFRRFRSAKDLASADSAEVEQIIRTTGFFRNKTKSVIGASKAIMENFGGEVPCEMEKLLTLSGVARKTANVVLGSWFGKNEGVVVDTHVFRLSHRLDFSKATDPVKMEQDLIRVVPRAEWTAFSHEMIHHGRQICIARKPRCADCPLEKDCHAPDKTWSTVWQRKPSRAVAKELA